MALQQAGWRPLVVCAQAKKIGEKVMWWRDFHGESLLDWNATFGV